MDKITISSCGEELDITIKNRHEIIDRSLESMRKRDEYKNLSDEQWMEVVKMDLDNDDSLYEKYSIGEYEELYKYPETDENFKDLKKVVESGKTHFNSTDEHPLFEQITRMKMGLLTKEESENQKKQTGKVMLSDSSYLNVKMEVRRKGHGITIDKNGEESIVKSKGGKLYEMDGDKYDREIISFSMMKEKFGEEEVQHRNPIQKKVWELGKEKGLDDSDIMELWSNNMIELTKMYNENPKDFTLVDLVKIEGKENMKDLEESENYVSGSNPYLTGGIMKVPNIPKVGRNESCPCGSGLKFKKCCLN